MRRSKGYQIVKGALFEVVVEGYLQQSGYRRIPADGMRVRHGALRGRGTWHQIDAFGAYDYAVPLVNEIRLISEAKCLDDQVDLPVVRNFAGALKDISENYFVADHSNERNLVSRYTDVGAIFSANGFTLDAQDFAYAQGIFLISYENSPVLAPVLKSMYDLIDHLRVRAAAKSVRLFKDWIRREMGMEHDYVHERLSFAKEDFANALREFNLLRREIRTSYLGTATRLYPVHLLSHQDFPWHLFKETDQTACEIHFEPAGSYLTIVPSKDRRFEFHISIPTEVFARYKADMTVFKEMFFNYVEIPTREGQVRRILRLTLDRKWLSDVRSRRQTEAEAAR